MSRLGELVDNTGSTPAGVEPQLGALEPKSNTRNVCEASAERRRAADASPHFCSDSLSLSLFRLNYCSKFKSVSLISCD